VNTYDRPLRTEVTADLLDYFMQIDAADIKLRTFDGCATITGDFNVAYGPEFDEYRQKLRSLNDKDLLVAFEKKRWTSPGAMFEHYCEGVDALDGTSGAGPTGQQKAERVVGALCDMFEDVKCKY
jgi:hypothetical protein